MTSKKRKEASKKSAPPILAFPSIETMHKKAGSAKFADLFDKGYCVIPNVVSQDTVQAYLKELRHVELLFATDKKDNDGDEK